MIFKFLKRQTEIVKKKSLIEKMILNINMPDKQKKLYIKALSIIDEQRADHLFNDITTFIQRWEQRDLQKIQKENFSTVAGMKKKDAHKKQKEINSFSFLINNI